MPAKRLAAIFLVGAVTVGSSLSEAVAKEPAGSIEFFENRIRPVLIDHCYQCHSSDSDSVGGSLLLDSSDGMTGGGDSGPAIVPGDASASILVSAIRYESSEMPPEGKLPDDVIADFEHWIAAGAVDPRHADATVISETSEIDLEAGRDYWAFRPLGVRGTQGTIDQYLSGALSDAGIRPNEQADAPALLRRLSFDLTGLPPSIQLQNQWMADPSRRHWQQIVDQMLASPEFAQHWARHWMDVARYADSNGGDFNATFHEAWRYRNYLVDSFAVDRPWDQMIRQQVAGDLLPASTDAQRYDNVVASTFLMLGTKMLSERDKPKLELDVVDEQIDTIGRAFLGLTLGCARCHDHKFDPIPTEDYYALAGIFKSTVTLKGESQEYVSTWNRVPLPTTESQRVAVQQYESDREALLASIKTAEATLKKAQRQAEDQLVGIVVDDSRAIKTGTWRESVYVKTFVGSGYVHDENAGKGDAEIRFETDVPADGRYEVRVAFSPNSNRASNVPVSIETADQIETTLLNQRIVSIAPMWSSIGVFPFTKSKTATVTLSNAGTDGYVIADAVQFVRQTEDSLPLQSTKIAGDRVEAAQVALDGVKAKLNALEASQPQSLPEAMAPEDRPSHELADSPLHIRGEAGNLGPIISRGFLQVCSGGDAAIEDPRGSGRLDLADWLTDPDHPLVARVFVNRVWMHLMGEGIVRTVDNFGTRGERPSHPELLDWIALQFVRDGWHLKPLVRRIVNSDAYQRSSEFVQRSDSRDPENRLLWRMHRRRLPAESIRDAMVAAAGSLHLGPTTAAMAGQKVLVSGNNGNSSANKIEGVDVPRRSMFLPVVRSYIPPMMAALDAADPDLLVGKRPTTNVPGQALVLINSPQVSRWAAAAATRIGERTSDFDRRLDLTYQRCFARLPTREDRQMASQFFGNDRDSIDAWQQWTAAMFAATEFRLLE